MQAVELQEEYKTLIYIGENPGVPMMEISETKGIDYMSSLYETSQVHRIVLMPND